MILKTAVAQFSLTVSKSTRAWHADESMHHLWKLFRWRFPSRHRLHFHWLFLSKQGLRALMNQRVTCGSGFVDYFWFGSGLVFVDYFWIKRGVLSRIQASPMEGVPLTISELVPTPFSFTFSKSIGVASASKSTRHLWNLVRWWFMTLQRLSFCWLFLSQQGLWALRNPQIFGIGFSDDFGVGRGPIFITVSKWTGAGRADESTRNLWTLFPWLFLSQQGLQALPNPCVTFGKIFRWYFPVGTDSILVDFF
jgi:hypothetical protein